jgi:hypothetical protein
LIAVGRWEPDLSSLLLFLPLFFIFLLHRFHLSLPIGLAIPRSAHKLSLFAFHSYPPPIPCPHHSIPFPSAFSTEHHAQAHQFCRRRASRLGNPLRREQRWIPATTTSRPRYSAEPCCIWQPGPTTPASHSHQHLFLVHTTTAPALYAHKLVLQGPAEHYPHRPGCEANHLCEPRGEGEMDAPSGVAGGCSHSSIAGASTTS